MSYLDPIDHTTEEFGELYDELTLWSAPFGLMLLDRVPIRSGLTVLDVGCGTGYLSIGLAERCGADARVIAVDPWKAAMDRFRRKIALRRLDNIVLLDQDAATLDLPDESVDVIISNLGINNFDQPDAVLRTCWRVAKPGAALLLTTNVIGSLAEFYDVYRATLVELGQRDRLAALEAHIRHRGTVDSVTRLLADAGFAVTDVATQTLRLRYANGSSLLRHHFIRLGFLPGWTSVAAAESVEHTFATLERRLNALAADRGEIVLTVPMLCVTAKKVVDDRGGGSA